MGLFGALPDSRNDQQENSKQNQDYAYFYHSNGVFSGY